MPPWIFVLLLAACGASKSMSAAKPPGEPPGTARTTERDATGGIVELEGDREAAKLEAERQMAEHCGADRYTIVNEGEESWGNATHGVNVAWRVHYRCKIEPAPNADPP